METRSTPSIAARVKRLVEEPVSAAEQKTGQRFSWGILRRWCLPGPLFRVEAEIS